MQRLITALTIVGLLVGVPFFAGFAAGQGEPIAAYVAIAAASFWGLALFYIAVTE